MKRNCFLLLMSLIAGSTHFAELRAQTVQDFWTLNDDGGITWTFDGRAHEDHIEMSGRRMSVVLR